MKDYLIKRPMLLCGILCCIISVAGFEFSVALFPIGITLAVAVGVLIFKKSKSQTVISLLLCIIMLLSMFITLGKIERLNRLDKTEDRAELVVCEEPRRYDGFYAAVVEVTQSKTVEKGVKIYAFFEPRNIEMGEIIVAD